MAFSVVLRRGQSALPIRDRAGDPPAGSPQEEVKPPPEEDEGSVDEHRHRGHDPRCQPWRQAARQPRRLHLEGREHEGGEHAEAEGVPGELLEEPRVPARLRAAPPDCALFLVRLERRDPPPPRARVHRRPQYRWHATGWFGRASWRTGARPSWRRTRTASGSSSIDLTAFNARADS